VVQFGGAAGTLAALGAKGLAVMQALADELRLLFAGIDLKQTPDGDYFCFEANPCPGFLYYERHTGQPISAALADLLRGSAARSRHEAAAAMS